MYRLHASPSAVSRHMPPIVLPDAASGSIDWDQLVTVASHALDGTIFQQSVLFNNNNNKCGAECGFVLVGLKMW